MTSKKAPQKAQKPARPAARGGFVIGLIVGLLIGLALALGVALYVTKVPIPFVNKIGDRAPEDDAAEAAKAKNWDPNAPLVGKVVKPILTEPASGAAAGSAPIAVPGSGAALPPATGSVDSGASHSTRNPGAILSGQPVSPAAAPMLPPRSTKPEAGAFTYFVQAGAFSRDEDAEQQRAKLAMQGITAKVSQREQSGRTVFRVRVGPFDKKEDAEEAQQKLQQGGTDAALVRVEGGAAAAQ